MRSCVHGANRPRTGVWICWELVTFVGRSCFLSSQVRVGPVVAARMRTIAPLQQQTLTSPIQRTRHTDPIAGQATAYLSDPEDLWTGQTEWTGGGEDTPPHRHTSNIMYTWLFQSHSVASSNIWSYLSQRQSDRFTDALAADFWTWLCRINWQQPQRRGARQMWRICCGQELKLTGRTVSDEPLSRSESDALRLTTVAFLSVFYERS